MPGAENTRSIPTIPLVGRKESRRLAGKSREGEARFAWRAILSSTRALCALAILCLARPASSTSLDWPTLRFDGQRSGSHSIARFRAPLESAWTAELGSDAWGFASPIIADGRIYIGGSNGELRALDGATGAALWSFREEGEIHLAPALSGGKLFFGSTAGRLVALNASTGEPAWAYATRSNIHSSPNVADGRVYFASNNGAVYALDTETGAVVWRKGLGGYIVASPALDAERLYIGTVSGRFVALSRATGELVWEAPANGQIRSAPALAGGAVIFGAHDGVVRARAAATGAALWSVSAGAPIFEGFAVSSTTLYLASLDGKLWAVDRNNGMVRWTMALGAQAHAGPALADGHLVVGTGDSKLYVVDASTPVVKQALTLSGPVGGPAALTRGTAFVMTAGGKLHSFRSVNNPPEAPQNLRVNGLSEPSINVASVTFSWIFRDPDAGDSQGGLQVQLALSADGFSVPVFDSGLVESEATQFSLPDATIEGTFYWHVRGLDSLGAAGPYSETAVFSIDARPPQVTITEPANGLLTRERRPRITAEYSELGSGLDGASLKLALDGVPFSVPQEGGGGDIGAWSEVTPLPGTLRMHQMVADGEHLYVIGGHFNGNFTDKVFHAVAAEDGSLSAWAPVTPLPQMRSRHAAAVLGGYIYVAGGLDPNNQRVTTVYFTRRNADGTLGPWQTGPPLPIVNFDFETLSLQVGQASLIAVGGAATGSGTNRMFISRLAPDGAPGPWQETNPLPVALRAFKAAEFDGRIYVAGGFVGSSLRNTVYHATVHEDGTVGPWLTGPALPLPLANAAMVANRDVLVHLGGFWGDFSNPSNQVLISAKPSAEMQPWAPSAHPMPRGLLFHDAAIARGYVYVSGGNAANFVTQSAVLAAPLPKPAPPLTASTRSFIPAADLPEGEHAVSASASDLAGNFGEARSVFSVDLTQPSISIEAPRRGERFVASAGTIEIRVGVSDNLDPAPRLTIALIQRQDFGAPRGGRPARVEVSSGQALLAALLDDGVWELEAVATDGAGNSTVALSGFFEVLEDSLAPRTTLSIGEPRAAGGPAGTLFVAAGTILNLRSSDDLALVGDGIGLGVTLQSLIVDGVLRASFTAESSSFTLAGHPDGLRELEFYAEDALAHRESTRSATMTLDATTPQTQLLIGEPRAALDDGRAVVGAGTELAYAAVDPTAGGSASGVLETLFAVDGATFTVFGGSFTLSVEGERSLTAFSRDRVLNEEASRSTSIVADLSPPDISGLVPAGGESFVARTHAVAVAFKVADSFDPSPSSAAVLVQLSDRGSPRGGRPAVVAVAPGQAFEPLELDDGIWALRVSATDFVLNSTTVLSGAFEIVHDVLPPRTVLEIGEPRADGGPGGSVYVASRTPLNLTSVDDLVAEGDGIGLGVAFQSLFVGGEFRSSFTAASSTFTLPDPDGLRALEFFAEDVLVIRESTRTAAVFFDNAPPAVGFEFSRAPVVREPENEPWFPEAFAIVWIATDAASGVAEVDPPSSVTVEGRDLAFTGRASDRLGNPGDLTLRVNLDKTAPLVSAGQPFAVVEGSTAGFSGTVADNLDAQPAFGWSFGDGVTAGQVLEPEHVYADNGEFYAVLTATDHAGHSSSATVRVTVLNAPPLVDAGSDRTLLEGAFLEVSASFTDPGVLDTHAAEVDWGDGDVSSMSIVEAMGSGTASARHAYGDNGAYAVVVRVTDKDGGIGIASFTAVVENAAPALSALPDLTADEGSFIQLTPAAFTDPGDLDTFSATIDWGDGTSEPVGDIALSSSGTIQARHAYGDNGVYTAMVVVRDDDGGVSSATFKVRVGNLAPSLAALPDLSANEGSFIQLPPAAFIDPGYLDGHTATVDWGDGTSEPAGDIILTVTPGSEGTATSGAIQARHAYGDNGVYTATVVVRDDDGGVSSSTFKVTVGNVAPALAALPDLGTDEGSFIQLPPAAFTDPGYLDAFSATIDWGDGTSEPMSDIALSATAGAEGTATSGAIQARHAYGDNGVYTATVVVLDDDGGISTQTFKVTINNVAPSLAALPDLTADEGSFIQLPPAAFSDPGYPDTFSAMIDWGDGTSELVSDVALAVTPGSEGTATSGTIQARHAYGDNGVYTAVVTVRDDNGGASTQTFKVTVGNVGPTLAALPDLGANEGSFIQLPPAVFTDPGYLDSFSATIDWGDGTSEPISDIAVTVAPGSEATPTSGTIQARHAYGDNGVYTAVVSVRDDDGGVSSSTFKVTVGNVAPTLAVLPDLGADEGSFIQLPPATFTDSGYLDAFSAMIDWGDGTSEPVSDIALTVTPGSEGATTSGTIQARHAYGDNGVYTAVVTVRDDDGGVSSSTFKVTVGNVAPSLGALPDFNADEGSFIQLPPATFTDPGYLDTFSATIDWGDGTSEPVGDISLSATAGSEGTMTSGTIQAKHAYGDNGVYTAVVTVRDDDGGVSSATFKVTVGNVAPALAALPDLGTDEGSFIQLPPAAFTDPGYLDAFSATIDWGDGTSEPVSKIALTVTAGSEGTATSGTIQARHAYGDNGVYTATVVVGDDDGGASTQTFKVTVGNLAPTMAALPDLSADEGSFIQLPPAVFTDPGYQDTLSATIDWGDGTNEPVSDIALAVTPGSEGTATSGTIQAKHAYGDNGVYTAVVTVRDDDGVISSATFKVTVGNVAPSLAALPDQGADEGSFIQLPPAAFTDSGYLDTFNATIDWGDGTSEPVGDIAPSATAGSEGTATSGTIQAKHAYGDNGIYTAVVTVRDDDGGASTQTFKVTVGNVAPTLAALPDLSADEGSFIQLPPAVFADPGYLDSFSATIDWGDGSSEPVGEIALSVTAGSEGTATSGTIQAKHAYGDNGVYMAAVVVRDDDGGASTQTFKVTVQNVAPTLAALPDLTANEGSFIQLPPAAFTDLGYLDTFSATIDWGDGTNEPVSDIALTVAPGAEGRTTSGTIQAKHAYADNGVYTAVVTVRDDDGGASSSTFKVTVGNVAPALAALPDLTADEGSFIQLPPAAFSDPGYLDSFSATIDWGDGTSEPVSDVALAVTPGSEGAATSGTIQARHAYGDNGIYTAVVTVRDDDGGLSSSTFKVTAGNVAPTLAALRDLSADEGSFIQLPPAAFTDPGYQDAFSATIDWGDGTSEPVGDIALAVTRGSEGRTTSGTIEAKHAYGDNGVYTAVVTVRDDDGGASTQTFKVTVGNVGSTLAALPDLGANEGSFIDLPPASFTDPGYLDTFSATIDWGDGTSEPVSDIGLIVTPASEGTPTSGTIQARHAYGDNGVYMAVVTVRDDDGGTSTQTFRVTVGNVASTLAALPDLGADEGSFIQLPPAAYTDPGYLDSHTATIDWGDGTSEPVGDIALGATAGSEGTATSGTIQAKHAYGDNGVYTALVTVRDDDGGVSSATFKVTVGNVMPALAALPDLTADEGSFIQLPPATFTDPGYLDTFSATIDWGDGTSEPVSDIILAVTPGAEGRTTSGTIQAKHAYGDNGVYTAVVAVRDDDGGASTQTFKVTVRNVVPALAALPDLTSDEGSLIQLPPATFTDPGYLDTFSATIDWGDGTSEPVGDITLSATAGSEGTATSGTIQAKHAYGDNGVYTAVVTVRDDDGGVSSSTFKVTVGNVAPTLVALPDLTADEGSFIQLPSAAFTDPGYLDSHTATVDWGDGASEPVGDIALSATVGAEGTTTSGTIQARHAYGDNGVYTAVVTVRDDDGGASTQTFKVTVGNVAPTLATLPDLGANEGSFIQLPPAVFTDPGYLDSFSATIDWGDGSSEPVGEIELSVTAGSEGTATSGTIQAKHAYGDNGVYTATVVVRDDDGGASTQTFKVTVGNIAPSLAALPDLTANEGSFIQLPPATFTDPGFDNPAGGTREDFTATIDWGDGTSEAVSDIALSATAGAEGTATSGTIQARHAYGDNGVYTTVVTVRDDDGGASTQTFKVTVRNVVPALAALPDLTSDEGSFIQLPPATFTDPGYLDTFSATIDWGDGTNEPVSDIALSATAGVEGTATVGTIQARHAYGDNGAYTAVVTMRDDDGGISSSTFKVTVVNVAPTMAALPDLSADEGSFIQLPPATFSDPGFDNPAAGTREDFSATIDWGDGISEPVSDIVLSKTPGGEGRVTSGTIQAKHAYADDGVYTATVVVRDDDGGASTQTFKVTVDNVAPTVAALPDLRADEGSFIRLPPAAFSDPGFDNPAGGTREDFTATIDWGDGTMEPVGDIQLAKTPGGEGRLTAGTIQAKHAYGDNGAYTATVLVRDDDGGTSTQTFKVTVSNVVPTLAGLPDLTADEGSFIQLPPAAFTDPGFDNPAGGIREDLTAAIDWGDGTTEPASDIQFTKTPGGEGRLTLGTIQARHAYGDNGVYTATVVVRDDDGGASTQTFKVTVNNGPPTLAALPDMNADEGSFIQLPSAAFTDPGFDNLAGGTREDFTATIDWGDGTMEPVGDIALSKTPGAEGRLTSGAIQAKHAYGDNGVYTATVVVRDDDGGASTQTFRVTVGNVAPTMAALPDLGANEGSFIQLPPAVFTDPGYLDSFSATIDWGDGSSEPVGEIALSVTAGSEGTATSGTIQAKHAYGDNGAYTAVVTMRDDDGGISSSTFKVTVGNVAPALAALPDLTAGEGNFIQLPPAVFTDPGYLDALSATVDWGDGTSEPVGDIALTVSPGSEGTATSGTIQARHAYGDNGTYTVVVTVRDDDGGASTQTFKVTVKNVAPSIAFLPALSVNEGDFIQLPPATFSDPGFDHPIRGTVEDFTAEIDWGDGTAEPVADIALTKSAGTEGRASAGTVQAKHAYGDNGVYTVTVKVADDDGGVGTQAFIVTVANVAPSVQVASDTIAAAGGVLLVGDALPVSYINAFVYPESTTLQSFPVGPQNPQVFPAALLDDPGFDSPAGGTREDFTALIDWGDGSTSALPEFILTKASGAEGVRTSGSITKGTHTYQANGLYPVTVRVIDDDSGAGAASFRVTVDREPPVTNAAFVGPHITAPLGGIEAVYIGPRTRIALEAVDPLVNQVAFGVQRSFWKDGPEGALNLYNGTFLLDREGGHSLRFFSADQRGNREGERSVAIALDATPPVPSFALLGGVQAAAAAAGTIYASSSTRVQFTAEDPLVAEVASGVELIEVSDNGGDFAAFGEPLRLGEGPHALSYKARDRVANASVALSTTVLIDATPPLSSFAIGSPFFLSTAGVRYITPDTELAFSAVDPEAAGVAAGVDRIEVSINGGPFTPYTAALRFPEGRYRVRFRALDRVANAEPEQALEFQSDATAPITRFVPSGTLFQREGRDYAPPSFTYTLPATDPLSADVASGVKETLFAVDDGPFALFAAPFALSEGIRSIGFHSRDNVGHLELLKSATVHVDATAPETALNIIGGAQASGPDAATFYASSATRIGFLAVDPVVANVAAGVERIEFQDNAGAFAVFSEPVKLTAGEHPLGYFATDHVGNAEVLRSTRVLVDAEAPVTSVSIGQPRFTDAAGVLFITPATPLDFVAEDPGIPAASSGVLAGAGVAVIEVAVDDGQFVAQVGSLRLGEGRHAARYRALDRVRNSEAAKLIEARSDNTAPVSVLRVGEPQFALENGSLLVSGETPFGIASIDPVVSDVASGVQEIRFRSFIATGTPGAFGVFTGTFTLAGPVALQTIEFFAIDNVANAELHRSSTVLLDAAKPTALINSPCPEDQGICRVFRGAFPVLGTVADDHFREYHLEAAPGLNALSGFVRIASGTASVENGVLGVWDAAAFSGFVSLRLTVVDQVENLSVARLNVYAGDPARQLVLGGKETFQQPQGVAAGPSDRIYVSDTLNNRVRVFSSSGSHLASFGGLNKPRGLAVDGAGSVFVADTASHRIVKLSSGGAELWERGLVLVDKQQRKTYKAGAGNGEFDDPAGLALDAAGNIYVADTDNRRVEVFGPDGAFSRSFLLPIADDFEDTLKEERGRRGKPVGIALDAAGNIYVADVRGRRALKFSPAGELLLTVGRAGQGAGEFMSPEGIAVSASGDCILVSDGTHERIQKFNDRGELTLFFGVRGNILDGEPLPPELALKHPAYLALDGGGRLLVADENNNRVQRFGLPEGTVLVVALEGEEVFGWRSVKKRITKEDGGEVVRADKTKVSIPPDALPEDTVITISAPEPDERERKLQFLVMSGRQMGSASEGAEYGPHDLQFKRPVTITLPYDEALLADAKNPESLRIHYWNPETSDWEELLSTVDPVARTVSAQTYHFSLYQVLAPKAELASAPSDFRLREVYVFPNPAVRGAAPVLHIEVGIADSVNLRIYNIAGQQAHEAALNGMPQIINDGTGADYAYEYPWNGHIPSGVYLYTIVAEKAGHAPIRKAGKFVVVR